MGSGLCFILFGEDNADNLMTLLVLVVVESEELVLEDARQVAKFLPLGFPAIVVAVIGLEDGAQLELEIPLPLFPTKQEEGFMSWFVFLSLLLSSLSKADRDVEETLEETTTETVLSIL